MAKEILKPVQYGGRVFLPGQEDELDAAVAAAEEAAAAEDEPKGAPPVDWDRLEEKGVVGSSGSAPAKKTSKKASKKKASSG
jgi:hypothetical protein